MSREDELIYATIDKYSEWLEMMEPQGSYNFILNALAVEAVRERDKAEMYKMALKRCEIMRR